MNLILIGSEKYLQGLKSFSTLTQKLNEHKWDEMIEDFDQDMCSYIPEGVEKYFTISSLHSGADEKIE